MMVQVNYLRNLRWRIRKRLKQIRDERRGLQREARCLMVDLEEINSKIN